MIEGAQSPTQTGHVEELLSPVESVRDIVIGMFNVVRVSCRAS